MKRTKRSDWVVLSAAFCNPLSVAELMSPLCRSGWTSPPCTTTWTPLWTRRCSPSTRRVKTTPCEFELLLLLYALVATRHFVSRRLFFFLQGETGNGRSCRRGNQRGSWQRNGNAQHQGKNTNTVPLVATWRNCCSSSVRGRIRSRAFIDSVEYEVNVIVDWLYTKTFTV